jgi:cytochrome oxidase Cu insertion factor (SCO1/SenC/PrrC family)
MTLVSGRIPHIALTLLTVALLAGGAVVSAAASGSALTEAGRALDLVALTGLPPEFALEVLDGGTWSLADLKGRPALLYFWATW